MVCLGTGPSLTQEDVDACRGRAKVIAIKHAIDLAPWADALYASGSDRSEWWQRHGDRLAAFNGLRYTLDPEGRAWATVLRNDGITGLSADPGGLKHGRNSGYAAINLAAHLGAARIVLLGYDMDSDNTGRAHYFGAHWHGRTPPFPTFIEMFTTIVEPLQALGIAVLNASRRSALTVFPRVSLDEALSV